MGPMFNDTGYSQISSHNSNNRRSMHNGNVVDHSLSYNVSMEANERKMNNKFPLLLSQTHEAVYADTLAQNTVSNMNPSYQAVDAQPQITKNQSIYTSKTRHVHVTEQESVSQANCTESTNRQSDTALECFIAPQYISETQSKTAAKQQIHSDASLDHGYHDALNKACSGNSSYQTVAHSQQFNSDNNNHYLERHTNYSHSSIDFENVTNSNSLNKSTTTPENTFENLSPNVNQMNDTAARCLNQSQNYEFRRNAMPVQNSFPRVTNSKPKTRANNVTVGKQDSGAVDKSQYSETLFERNPNLNLHSASTFEKFANSDPLNASTETAENPTAYLTPTVKQMNYTTVRYLNQSQTFENGKNAIVRQNRFLKTIDDKLMTYTNNAHAEEQNSDLIANSSCKQTYNEMSNATFDTPISALCKGKVDNEKYFVTMDSLNQSEISTSDTQRITSTDHKLSQNNLEHEGNRMFYSLESCTNSNRFKFNNTNALSLRTSSSEVSFNEKVKNVGASAVKKTCCSKYFSDFNEKDSYGSSYSDIENLILIAKAVCGNSLNCSFDYDENCTPPLSAAEAGLFQNAAPVERKGSNGFFKNTYSLENSPQLEIPNITAWKQDRKNRSLPSAKLSNVSANAGIETANIDNKKRSKEAAETSNFARDLNEIYDCFCTHCGKKLSISRTENQLSLQNIHVNKFLCKFCLKVSCSQVCFQNHELTHTHCSSKVDKFPTLKQHSTKRRVTTGKNQESCVGNVCEISSKDKENIPSNGINYNVEKSHSCYKCNKCFFWKGHLIRHKLFHCKNKEQILLLPDEKPVCCEICYKPFSRKNNLKAHLRNIHSIK